MTNNNNNYYPSVCMTEFHAQRLPVVEESIKQIKHTIVSEMFNTAFITMIIIILILVIIISLIVLTKFGQYNEEQEDEQE